MAPPESISLHPLAGMPLVEPDDDIARLVGKTLRTAGLDLVDDDVLVIAQKIVSKAEGRYVDLDAVIPSRQAIDLAKQTGKDPRHVEVVLSESTEVVKTGAQVIIVAHRLGFVMANAGVDESNIQQPETGQRLLLLPKDPDGSAARLKHSLEVEFAVRCGVVISDSFGRAWRNGVVGVAIGAAGVPALANRIGTADLFGRQLKVTDIGVADELASAASLLMGQAAEGIPAVLVRGFHMVDEPVPASALVRHKSRDLFR